MKVKVIPCIDICDGKAVKGVKYRDMKVVGVPLEMALKYEEQGADEIVISDISATTEERHTNIDILKEIAARVKTPLIMGGGVGCIEDADKIMEAGAKRVTIGTAAMRKPELISECAEKYGIKSVVITIDCKPNHSGTYDIWINGGTENTMLDAVRAAVTAEKRGAGRILLTNFERHGTCEGYDLNLIKAVSSAVKIPVIASGGAGTLQHFAEAARAGAAAVLAAGVFHYGNVTVKEIKDYLTREGIETF